jgi:hypothetical protein
MKRYVLIFVLSALIYNCKKNKSALLFTRKDNVSTNIRFKNNIVDNAKYNIVNYLYYYNGAGVAVGDINNDMLPDIYFVSNRGENKLYLNQGGLKFKDITNTAGVKGASDWNTGVTMVDLNNDGLLDIYVCAVTGLLNFKGHNELFINNGDGTFTEKSKEFGLDFKGYATQAYFFDYDKDGDLDTYIVNHAIHTKESHGPAFIRKKRSGFVGDVLLQNNNQKFIDISEEANIFGGVNGYGLSASIADFNNDGWDDIYVCNDFHEDDYYYINNQDGTFKESLAKNFSYTSRFSMGSDVADINRDGYQDIITLDMLPYDEKVLKESDGDVSNDIQTFLLKQGYHRQYARNMLQLNNEGRYFTEVGLFNGVAATDWSWAPLFADFNQDGYQDLFISNGIYKRPNNLDFMKYISTSFKNKSRNASKSNWLLNSLKEMPQGKVPNQLFKGTDKKFINKTGRWIDTIATLSNGAVYADLDLDGDLDIVTNNLNEMAVIYQNNTDKSKNYLKVKLSYTEKNSYGIGAKVILYHSGEKQLKQLFTSRGFLSSIEPKFHFGLGEETSIDSLLVIWPDNTYQKVANLEVNKEIEIKYIQNSPTYRYDKKQKEEMFERVSLIDFVHQEDSYNDFNFEKLIPYKVSTAGPALATGDINNDGFKDVFIGNSSGKKAQMYINNGQRLIRWPIAEIENDSLNEDIDAVFFDADNDNDLDLYVVSGINAVRNTTYENDRLYLNNGKGLFTKSKGNIPDNLLNGACVKPCDYDNDGDIDVFIGNRSVSNDVGAKVNSYLLKNNGNGNFTIDEHFSLQSKVTDAIWGDVNNDGAKDLIISTEWDTPKIYINKKGNLIEKKLSQNLSGLWQTVTTYDIDADGDQDILLGNWGLNTRFHASKESPLVMYTADFDSNGKKETVLAYNVEGTYFPVNSKDELSAQMNYINKKFVTYKDYAKQPIEKVIGAEKLAKAHAYKVHQLASGYLMNENGSFEKFVEFDTPLQWAPIMKFLKYPFIKARGIQLLESGNFYDVNTYQGVFSSNNGYLIFNDTAKQNKQYKKAIDLGLELYNKQMRKMAIITLKNKKLLITVPNSDTLKTYYFK